MYIVRGGVLEHCLSRTHSQTLLSFRKHKTLRVVWLKHTTATHPLCVSLMSCADIRTFSFFTFTTLRSHLRVRAVVLTTNDTSFVHVAHLVHKLEHVVVSRTLYVFFLPHTPTSVLVCFLHMRHTVVTGQRPGWYRAIIHVCLSPTRKVRPPNSVSFPPLPLCPLHP